MLCLLNLGLLGGVGGLDAEFHFASLKIKKSLNINGLEKGTCVADIRVDDLLIVKQRVLLFLLRSM